MRHPVGKTVLRWISIERGAVLWIPSLLAATYLVLFAMQHAPRPILFNRMTALRVLVGPWSCSTGDEIQRDRLLQSLRHGLEPQAEFALLDSARVARWIGYQEVRDEADFLRLTRALNAQLCLTGSIESLPDGYRVRLEAWKPRDAKHLLTVQVQGAAAVDLGRQLADSLSAAVFRPRALIAKLP